MIRSVRTASLVFVLVAFVASQTAGAFALGGCSATTQTDHACPCGQNHAQDPCCCSTGGPANSSGASWRALHCGTSGDAAEFLLPAKEIVAPDTATAIPPSGIELRWLPEGRPAAGHRRTPPVPPPRTTAV